ncbi:MAG: hypothetical protein AAB332_05105 [Planctomycetota bacterium]
MNDKQNQGHFVSCTHQKFNKHHQKVLMENKDCERNKIVTPYGQKWSLYCARTLFYRELPAVVNAQRRFNFAPLYPFYL